MVTTIQKPVTGQPEKVTGSIAHATEILVCLADDIHKVSDIARRTGFSKSTVHRVLKLMEQSRLAVQDTINRRYYLGPLITRLASNAITTHKRLITCADSEMKRLAYLSEETVVMDIMMGLKYLPIHEIPSRHNLKVSQEIKKNGQIYDRLYAGASVKVLLAQLDDKRLCMLMSIVSIPAVTSHTITDKRVLLAQIAEIRKLGYSISRSERIPDTVCIAVPVFHYNLPVSLCVVGPDIRLQSRIREVVIELKASSIRISKNIADIFGERKPHDTRLLLNAQ
jgi:IclR family transcriptional regulator, acetate operon repressor